MTREEAFEKLEQTVGIYLMSGNADDTYCKEWRETLETLKQEPKTEWIPVSERLPEEGRYVLCSQSNGDVGEGKLLQDSCGEWLILYDNLIVDDGKVIAWMPLPTAYKK